MAPQLAGLYTKEQQGTQRTVEGVATVVTGLVTFGHDVAVFAVVLARCYQSENVYLLQQQEPRLKLTSWVFPVTDAICRTFDHSKDTNVFFIVHFCGSGPILSLKTIIIE